MISHSSSSSSILPFKEPEVNTILLLFAGGSLLFYIYIHDWYSLMAMFCVEFPFFFFLFIYHIIDCLYTRILQLYQLISRAQTFMQGIFHETVCLCVPVTYTGWFRQNNSICIITGAWNANIATELLYGASIV